MAWRLAMVVMLAALGARAGDLEGVAAATMSPQSPLTRRLSDQERGYYGKVLATILRATKTGCKPESWRDGTPRSLEQVETLVEREALLLPVGAFPRAPLGISLLCTDARRHQTSVHYSPKPIDLRPRTAEKILDSGAGFSLSVDSYGFATLVVNAPAARAGAPSVERLAPIMGIRIVFFADGQRREEHDLQSSVAEARAADVASMRAALAAALPPPAVKAGCGAPEPRPALVDADADEVAVFSALVRHHLRREPEGQVVFEVSSPFKLEDATAVWFKKTAPCLRSGAVESFGAVANQATMLPRAALLEAGFALITEEQLGKLFGRSDESWEGFEAAFPQSRGMLHFSHVGFSKDRTQAMVYVGWTAGMLLGSGELFVLQKSGASWQVLYVSHLWDA